jgi:copper oxidase (laccase) domain-containing protein
LAQSGLSDDRVADMGLCTYDRPDLFPSYRRDAGQCGRLVAAVGVL